MSLLDDARRLSDGPYPKDDQGYCLICDGAHSEDHKPDCPWLSMPKIVAALEAAEQVIHITECVLGAADEPACEYGIQHVATYVFCDGNPETGRHAQDCRWQALVAALKGEEGKA